MLWVAQRFTPRNVLLGGAALQRCDKGHIVSSLHSLLKNQRFGSGLAFRRTVTFSTTPSGAGAENRSLSANASAPNLSNR